MMEQTPFLVAISLVAVLGVCLAADDSVTSLVDVISTKDQARLFKILDAAQPYEDVRTAYLIVRALQSLDFTEASKKSAQIRNSACVFVENNASPDLRDTFYLASIKDMLKDTKEPCKVTLSPEAKQAVKNALTGESSVENLYYAISTMAYTGMKIDNTTVPQLLMTAVENDDSPLSYARAFHAAALIPDADLTDLFDQIEDIVAQADETPTTLYYDGGVKVTSLVVTGIFALATRTSNAPAITQAQVTKFGNYFLSSKYTTAVDNLSYMLAAANTLATNKYVVPSSLRLSSNQPISQSNKNLAVELTTIMGRSVGSFDVRVNTITDPDGTETKRGKPMSPGTDKITFTYPLFNDLSDPGIYTVTLSTEAKKTSAVISLPGVEVQVAHSFEVTVGSAQLLLKDQDVTTKTVSLSYPGTSKDLLEVDQHSRIVMTFSLVNKNKNTKKVRVHQAFVRFSVGDKEITYVTKHSTDTGDYSFELDVNEAATDFGSLSNSYAMTLIVGDFAIENPFSWNVATVKFKFPATAPVEKVDPYSALPVIEHMFRVPEKRPPVVISTTFTVLALLPLALLFLLWIILGANISNIGSGGIWAILFHLGLGGILALFYCFWTQLNMFQTLKYLAGLGVFTFLTGNRMLRNIAKSKQV